MPTHDEDYADEDDDDMATRRRKAVANGMLAENNSRNVSTSHEMELMPLSSDRFNDEEASALVPGDKDDLKFGHVTSSIFPSWLEDFLFPPSLPRECQLLRLENVAVPGK